MPAVGGGEQRDGAVDGTADEPGLFMLGRSESLSPAQMLKEYLLEHILRVGFAAGARQCQPPHHVGVPVHRLGSQLLVGHGGSPPSLFSNNNTGQKGERLQKAQTETDSRLRLVQSFNTCFVAQRPRKKRTE